MFGHLYRGYVMSPCETIGLDPVCMDLGAILGECICRIIQVSKWLQKSPKNRVIPLPNG